MREPIYCEEIRDGELAGQWRVRWQDVDGGVTVLDETVEPDVTEIAAAIAARVAPTPDPEAIMQAARQVAKEKVVQWAQSFLAPITNGYPMQEMLSWSSKLVAARAVMAGSPQTIIAIEAAALGIPQTVLASKIIAKGEKFETLAALTSAIRTATMAGIDQATTPEQIDAVLAAAMAQAETQFAMVMANG